MKLFRVRIEAESVVYAESEAAACEIAARDADEVFDLRGFFSGDIRCQPLGGRLPDGWTGLSLPFQADGLEGLTIDEIRAKEQTP